MKKSALFMFVLAVLSGCAPSHSPKAIYAIARQDRYSGVEASRNFFRADETPCIKISGYGSSTFSYKLYKKGTLESIDSGNVTKLNNNENLTCWKNLPSGTYEFQIYNPSGTYIDTIIFIVGE
jgi:hypothetical protein